MPPYVLAGLVVVILLSVLASATDHVAGAYLTLAYLFLCVVALDRYDARENDGISPLLSLQIGLFFAVGTVLVGLVSGGIGLRTVELAAVLVATVAFVLARDDVGSFLPASLPYLAAYTVLFGVFLHHARPFAAGSGMGLFPVLAGLVLAFNLFVLPRYLTEDAAYWSISVVAAVVAAVGLPAAIVGDFSVGVLEVRTWGESAVLGAAGLEIPVLRSVFANPNTFGLLMFPGVVTSAVLAHRTHARTASSPVSIVPIGCLGLTTLGLWLSNSRAGAFATVVALGIYASYVLHGRGTVPRTLATVAVASVLLLVAIHASILPIDLANRFALWRAGFDAVRHDASLLGRGLVGTRGAIEPYLADGNGGFSVHNAYLSIAIRTGILGVIAYLVLVLGPLVHGALRIDRANVPMLGLATGFAIHQLFEGYTLYGFGPGSVVGALALGYVVAGLTTGETRTIPTPADSSAAEPALLPDVYRPERDDRHRTDGGSGRR